MKASLKSAFYWRTFEQPGMGPRETPRAKTGPKAKDILRDNTGHHLCTPIPGVADADRQQRIKGRP